MLTQSYQVNSPFKFPTLLEKISLIPESSQIKIFASYATIDGTRLSFPIPLLDTPTH